MSEQKNKLLEVKDLKVSFFTPAGEVKAVGGISYDLDYGEVMGVVGESGSGKSQEAYSIMGLLQSPGKVIGGSITFEGKDVLSFSTIVLLLTIGLFTGRNLLTNGTFITRIIP